MLLAIVALGVRADRTHTRADFVFVQRGEVSTLDPAMMSWLQDFRVGRCLYEGLTRRDVFSERYEPLPGVAESWDISEDGLVYTFRLNPNAKWSNGEPVRAGDFVYAWRRVMLPESGGDYAKLFGVIRGADAFRASRARDLAAYASGEEHTLEAAERLWAETTKRFDLTVGLKALDDRTLRVELERPTPYFLDLTGFGALFPVYPPLVRAHERLDPATGMMRTQSSWTRPGTLVSNGAFSLTAWRFKRDMRLDVNPHYHMRDRLNIDSISIPSIPDGNAQVVAFRTGAVDWTSDVMPFYRGEVLAAEREFSREHAGETKRLASLGLDPIEIDRRLPQDARNHAHAFPTFGTYFYNFNCRTTLPDGRANPFADARVRRAFSLAIDRESLTTYVVRGGEPPASTLIPPGSIGGYASPAGIRFDPVEARRELADAGFPGGKGFPAVELLFNAEGDHVLVAQAVARDWERELGVPVRLIRKELRAFREDLKNGRFMVSRGSWFGDYGDPTTFLDINRTGDGNNDRGFSSGAFDQLLDQAAAEQGDTRLDTLARAEKLLIEREAPLAPIYQHVQTNLFDARRIGGISPHPRQDQDMTRVDVLGDGKGRETSPIMHP